MEVGRVKNLYGGKALTRLTYSTEGDLFKQEGIDQEMRTFSTAGFHRTLQYCGSELLALCSELRIHLA